MLPWRRGYQLLPWRRGYQLLSWWRGYQLLAWRSRHYLLSWRRGHYLLSWQRLLCRRGRESWLISWRLARDRLVCRLILRLVAGLLILRRIARLIVRLLIIRLHRGIEIVLRPSATSRRSIDAGRRYVSIPAEVWFIARVFKRVFFLSVAFSRAFVSRFVCIFRFVPFQHRTATGIFVEGRVSIDRQNWISAAATGLWLTRLRLSRSIILCRWFQARRIGKRIGQLVAVFDFWRNLFLTKRFLKGRIGFRRVLNGRIGFRRVCEWIILFWLRWCLAERSGCLVFAERIVLPCSETDLAESSGTRTETSSRGSARLRILGLGNSSLGSTIVLTVTREAIHICRWPRGILRIGSVLNLRLIIGLRGLLATKIRGAGVLLIGVLLICILIGVRVLPTRKTAPNLPLCQRCVCQSNHHNEGAKEVNEFTFVSHRESLHPYLSKCSAQTLRLGAFDSWGE